MCLILLLLVRLTLLNLSIVQRVICHCGEPVFMWVSNVFIRINNKLAYVSLIRYVGEGNWFSAFKPRA